MNPEKLATDITLAQSRKYQALSIFTDGKPWDKNRYIKNLREACETHALSGIEIGKNLIIIKEMLGEGEFVPTLGLAGISKTAAYRYMQIALRFAGFDGETVQQLGVSKLYKMLKAPQSEIDKLEAEGEFLDMSKEDVMEISVRELDDRIKETLKKVTDDVADKDARLTVLYEENKQMKSEVENLKKEAERARAGEPPEQKLPNWWPAYTAAIGALGALAVAIKDDKPNLEDLGVEKQCAFIADRLERELRVAIKPLRNWVADPDEVAAIGKARTADIVDENGEFDVEKMIHRTEG